MDKGERGVPRPTWGQQYDICTAVITLSHMMPICILSYLWSPYVIGQTIYIFILSFVPLSSFFLPRLISAVGDWMSAILPHMVWPYCEFRMQV